MAYKVGPTEIDPTHVFSLSDGTTTKYFLTCDNQGNISPRAGWLQAPMPRTALKLQQGSASYEDFELPFTSIEMKDWGGGRAAEDFESDTTKYNDARHCDTIRGDIICGPLENISEQWYDAGDNVGGKLEYDTAYEVVGDDFIATLFTPDDDYDVLSLKVIVHNKVDKLYVKIWDDDSGPDSELAATEIDCARAPGGIPYVMDILLEELDITDGTEYWIGVRALDTTTGYQYYYTYDDTGGEVWTDDSGDEATWAKIIDDETMCFEIYEEDGHAQYQFRFFEYKRSLYAVRYSEYSGSVYLYRNGYRGAGGDNSADLYTTITDQDLSDTEDLAGCILLIIEGPGSEEDQPWRVIESYTTTGTNDTITVKEPWKIDQTTATSWVIVGSNDWENISSHCLTERITDIAIVDDYVIFAQGSDENMRRMKEYNNSGAWTTAYEDDGSNKADLLLFLTDDEGTRNLWRAIKSTCVVDYGEKQDWGTGTTFGADIIAGSTNSKITNLIGYGDPKIPYVLKEDSFGSIEEDIYAEVPVDEMKYIRSESNGLAVMVHGVYLYFNMDERIERYYDRVLDDVGPDRDEGFVQNRKGIVRKLLGYPGRYYALISTHNNVPAILCNNGLGWHEVWRGKRNQDANTGATGNAALYDHNLLDETGGISNDMIVQVLPGNTIDRLFFDFNNSIRSIPISHRPQNEVAYPYEDLSQITTAWIYGSLKDVNKYWHSIKLHTENLVTEQYVIKIEYQTDEETTWTTAGYAYTSPIQEIDLSSSYNVTGYRIRFRLTLATDGDDTPRIVAIVVKGVIRVDVKKGWNVRIVTDSDIDLNENEDDQGNHMTQLDTWADSDQTAEPLTLRHNISYYDNNKVFIDPASLSFLTVELTPKPGSTDREYREIAEFAVYEV